LEAGLRGAGILVRSMAGKPLIDGSLRVSIGSREQMERFWRAFAALADQAYVEAYVAEVSQARDWLVGQLRAKGVRHHVDGGNYLLLWPRAPAVEVEDRLQQAGILVRSMAGKPLIDGSLRVSLGTTAQMERFWQAYRRMDAPT
jgi:histidinol-phosphate aminotransferase